MITWIHEFLGNYSVYCYSAVSQNIIDTIFVPVVVLAHSSIYFTTGKPVCYCKNVGPIMPIVDWECNSVIVHTRALCVSTELFIIMYQICRMLDQVLSFTALNMLDQLTKLICVEVQFLVPQPLPSSSIATQLLQYWSFNTTTVFDVYSCGM